MSGKVFVKNQNYDPILIISQILMIFGVFYSFFIIFILVFDTVLGLKVHLDQILSVDSIELSTKYGLASVLSLIFTNIILVILMIFTVEKANKVLDYVLTNFLFHFILTTINSRKIPFCLSWWLINGAVVTVVTVVTEYICLTLERKEISLVKIESDNKV